MDWQFLHKYLRVKRAKLSSNKGELYTKEDLHTKVTNARNNLNIMVNYLVNQTNLIDSVRSKYFTTSLFFRGFQEGAK